SWIDLGWLSGRYEGKQRSDDSFRISDRDLYDFCRNHLEELFFHRWTREGLEWLLSVIGESAPELIESPERKEEGIFTGGVAG
ncbi:MAG: hypothetical protein ACRD2L_00810, partial [Terriglobia bacterium]